MIQEHPIWGSFGSHVTRGSIGSYAHNYLSAWENYGLIGVTTYLMLTIVACVVGAYRCFGGGRYSTLWLFSFVVNTICLILVIVSKPVFWPLVAFGWGLHAKAVGEAQEEAKSRIRPQVQPSVEVPAGHSLVEAQPPQ